MSVGDAGFYYQRLTKLTLICVMGCSLAAQAKTALAEESLSPSKANNALSSGQAIPWAMFWRVLEALL